jgi:hypothetical protein
MVRRRMRGRAENLVSGSPELRRRRAIFESDVSFEIDAMNSFTYRFQDQFALAPELSHGLFCAFVLDQRTDLPGSRME